VDKGYEDWPYVDEDTGLDHLADFVDGEEFIKSISIAARLDDELGISIVFPAFVIRHFNEPVSGGWILNRVYLKDQHFRDLGWQLLYTPSASRWIDQYIAAGVEWDSDGTDTKTWFASEMGLKFRFDLTHSPFGFLSRLTDFWGLRAGIRYQGYKHFSEFGYVIEIGGGTF